VTDKVDLVVHFRQVITQRYNLYTWITACASATCVLLLLILEKGGWASSLISMACAMSLGLMVRNLNLREKMLHHLDRCQDDHFSPLENFLETKQNQWQNNLWIRLMVGAVTAVGMIFLLLFNADPLWSMTLASFFIIFILAIAILGWINFNDQLFLHDIRRSHRDHHSNKPE
jgi:ABC-type multidrug transport system fused ATPase/permease subunit